MAALATLSGLKSRLKISDSGEDALLTLLLDEASDQIEQYCGRRMRYVDADQVDLLDGGCGWVRVARWPIVAVIEIREDADREFGAATALDESDYFLAAERGRIHRAPEGAVWQPGLRTVMATTRGGWLDPAAVAIEGVDNPPSHVQSACLLQAVYAWERRRGLSAGSQSAIGPGGVLVNYGQYGLLDSVKALLRQERA